MTVRLAPIFVVPALVLLLAACAGAEPEAPVRDPVAPTATLSTGTGRFLFTGSAGARERPVTVHYHRSAALTSESPIVFVMHGNGRTAENYRDVWIPLAEEYAFLLVVPEFSREEYPSSRQYHQGNIVDADGAPVDSTAWSFTTVEAIFDEVRARSGNTNTEYSIYGHSAGSQFVHRMLYFMPGARIEEAVLANAGWYTMPSADAWPYGLGEGSTDEELEVRLRGALSRTVTVLLGDADVDTSDPDLRTTPEAMAQGIHRFERGHTFHRAAAEAAAALGVPFDWSLQTVPGVAHSNRGMAPAAAAVLMRGE